MEPHKQEIELHRIFNHLDEGIILLDINDTIQWISEPGVEILGDYAGELIGEHIDEIFIKGSEIELLDESLIEMNLPGEGGKRIYITFKYVPLKDKNGNIWKSFLFKDISLMKDLEEELRKKRSDALIITRNPHMKEILDLIKSIAVSNATVLIQGESGTGKGVVARMIHQYSRKNEMPFIMLNCSAFPETLLEDELFGHIKGAYTGAFTDKPGRFEIADGGTIFLDEIGDLSPHLQVKLLRVIQERSFERLGSNRTIKVDVRVIAATNRNLKEDIKSGRFRKDLFYRLNVVPLHLPPLKERREDIPLLINHFLNEFGEKEYKKVKGISSDVMDTVMNYEWPGNIRELKNVIEHALVCIREDIITYEALPFELRKEHKNDITAPSFFTVSADSSLSGRNARKPYKRVSVEDCLSAIENCGGNKAMAARALGINRSTLHRKIMST